MITYRKATINDIRPALDLALDLFMEFQAPTFSESGINKFVTGCINNEKYISNYTSEKHMMFVAVSNKKVIGIISERGHGQISMMFVDKKYHRQGIATKLMELMVNSLKNDGVNLITVNSSPYAVPFYHNFGFIDTDIMQAKDGFIYIPMVYDPKEIKC
jgi:GNAT superfamily N-acetyltransferase